MIWTKSTWLRKLGAVLETGNILLAKLLIRDYRSARLLPQAIHNEYMKLARDDRWSTREVDEVFPELGRGCRISLQYMPGHGLSTEVRELANLGLVTKAVEPKSIFEIGTYRGRSALNFAVNSPADCEIYTLDLPSDEREDLTAGMHPADRRLARRGDTGADYREFPVSEKITQLYADSLTFDFSPYEGAMDLVYVDGAHHYDAVRSDTENALRMVRPGGVIMWDDFGHYGDYFDVTRAVLDTVNSEEIVQLGATNQAVYRAPTDVGTDE